MSVIFRSSRYSRPVSLAAAVTASTVFFVKQKTAYEMRISDWSSDVCSSDLVAHIAFGKGAPAGEPRLDDIAGDRTRDGRKQVVGIEIADAGQIGRASCRERVCQYV